MFKSIQWTLQLWHAALLAVVLAGFGAASYFGIARARYQELDAELERSVQVLASGFHPPVFPTRSHDEPATSPSDWLAHAMRNPPILDFDVPAAIAHRFVPGTASYHYVIWDFERKVLKSSGPAADVPYAGEPPALPPEGPRFGPPQIRQRGQLREAYMNGPFGTRLLVGTSVEPQRAELRRLAMLLGGIGAGVLVVGLVGGWLISRRAIRPIGTMTAVAQEISATNLSRRIDVSEIQSELGSLAAVLNQMFARLEAAFQQQVRFTADASHELRTPLTVIHTHAQLALTKERSAEEYRKTIETCLRASTRMKELVDSLLLLAGADAGRLSLVCQPMNLRDVVDGCLPMVATLAEKKHVLVQAELKPAELSADPTRLAQVTTNLLTNAIRYNREGGHVHVAVVTEDGEAVLTISDTGVGIPPESQPHVFERFFRVDKARSRAEGGSGLGLAICKSIVEAHGGTIFFRSRVGEGTVFTVRLPLAQPGAPA